MKQKKRHNVTVTLTDTTLTIAHHHVNGGHIRTNSGWREGLSEVRGRSATALGRTGGRFAYKASSGETTQRLLLDAHKVLASLHTNGETRRGPKSCG